MKIIAFAVCCFIHLTVIAQDSSTNVPKVADTAKVVSVEAKFPGGQNAWRAFLEEYIHPNTAAKHKAPVGNYTVEVSFLVDVTGKVSNVQIVQDPGYGTADDVLKVFKHSPDWLPATLNGKAVIYRQKQRIMYQVTEK